MMQQMIINSECQEKHIENGRNTMANMNSSVSQIFFLKKHNLKMRGERSKLLFDKQSNQSYLLMEVR